MRVACFGEVLLRLSAPGHERLFQSGALDASFGGAEANVAVSCANFGMDTRLVTRLPFGDVGDACVRFLRPFGVDVSHIVRRADGCILSREGSGAASVEGDL